MKQRIINYLLRTVVRIVVPEDVVRDERGILYLGRDKITLDEIRVLKAEIKSLEGMRIWSIINESVKRKAFEKGWRDSTTMEHLNTAKTMYTTLDIQSSILNRIKGLQDK